MSEYTLEQMKEHRRLWVEALRSEKYKQGQGVLRSTDDRYCCLGVLCDLAGVEWRVDYCRRYRAGDMFSVAPRQAMDFVGLADNAAIFGGGDALSSQNDRGISFDKIADVIESNPPGLFIDSMEEAR